MNSEQFEAINRRLDEQTAMLGATMLVMCAAASMLTKDQFSELLKRTARDSAEKQAFVEQSQIADPTAAVRLMQKAEQVVFATLQQTWTTHNQK